MTGSQWAVSIIFVSYSPCPNSFFIYCCPKSFDGRSFQRSSLCWTQGWQASIGTAPGAICQFCLQAWPTCAPTPTLDETSFSTAPATLRAQGPGGPVPRVGLGGGWTAAGGGSFVSSSNLGKLKQRPTMASSPPGRPRAGLPRRPLGATVISCAGCRGSWPATNGQEVGQGISSPPAGWPFQARVAASVMGPCLPALLCALWGLSRRGKPSWAAPTCFPAAGVCLPPKPRTRGQ